MSEDSNDDQEKPEGGAAPASVPGEKPPLEIAG